MAECLRFCDDCPVAGDLADPELTISGRIREAKTTYAGSGPDFAVLIKDRANPSLEPIVAGRIHPTSRARQQMENEYEILQIKQALDYCNEPIEKTGVINKLLHRKACGAGLVKASKVAYPSYLVVSNGLDETEVL